MKKIKKVLLILLTFAFLLGVGGLTACSFSDKSTAGSSANVDVYELNSEAITTSIVCQDISGVDRETKNFYNDTNFLNMNHKAKKITLTAKSSESGAILKFSIKNATNSMPSSWVRIESQALQDGYFRGLITIIENVSGKDREATIQITAEKNGNIIAVRSISFKQTTREHSWNCYAWALVCQGNWPSAIDPGDLSGDYSEVSLPNIMTKLNDDLSLLGRSVRPIDGPWDDIYSNEYRIAFRVRQNSDGIAENSGYGYHFMKQLTDGQWSEVAGSGGEYREHSIGMTPDEIVWRGYPSVTLYFALTKSGASLGTQQFPSVPVNLKVETVNKQTTFSWEKPASEGTSKIIGYQVSNNGGYTWKWLNKNAFNYSFSESNAYGFWVRAVNILGLGQIAKIQENSDMYTIIYDANGGTGAPEQQTFYIGSPCYISMIEPIRTNNTFLGWSKDKSATVASFTPGLTYSFSENTILYAIYVWYKSTYTITYNSILGINGPSPQTFNIGSPCYLSAKEPTRINYTFLGWSKDKSAKVASYTPGGTYQFSEDTTLYSVWKIQTYTVTYNANGGSGAPSKLTVNKGNSFNISGKEPVRTGYIFLGWSTSSTATISSLSPSSTCSFSKDTTLYAVWATTYTVTFNANGGSGAPSSLTFNAGSPCYLSATKPTRTNYDFLGWATSSTATTASYTPGETYQFSSNTTLYAVWKIQKCTITYNANGGSGAPASVTVDKGSTINISGTKPTRTNYDFLGWSTSSAATASSYSPSSTCSFSANTTLYAVWKIQTYTVTYNANGGSGAPSKQTVNKGSNCYLSATKPTRANYDFLGWATSSTATVASYTPGQTYQFSGNTTLYAIWKRQTYTVTYNANGGSGAPNKQTVNKGTSFNISGTKPTRTNYTFLGWSKSSSATTSSHSSGSTCSFSANTTLYAVWKIQTYTVTYNANGGSGAPSKQTVNKGSNCYLSAKKPTRTNYTFLGWSKSSSATVASYTPGGTYQFSGNTTLYAIWKRQTYTVTYNANGGSGAPSKLTVNKGNSFSISGTKPTRANYTFLGWSKSSSATASSYSPGSTCSFSANTTLYAVWKIQTYTITFYANGGSGAPGQQTVNKGSNCYLTVKKPTRAGYTFLGWSKTSSATVASYTPGGTYQFSGNTVLFAVWKKN